MNIDFNDLFKGEVLYKSDLTFFQKNFEFKLSPQNEKKEFQIDFKRASYTVQLNNNTILKQSDKIKGIEEPNKFFNQHQFNPDELKKIYKYAWQRIFSFPLKIFNKKYSILDNVFLLKDGKLSNNFVITVEKENYRYKIKKIQMTKIMSISFMENPEISLFDIEFYIDIDFQHKSIVVGTHKITGLNQFIKNSNKNAYPIINQVLNHEIFTNLNKTRSPYLMYYSNQYLWDHLINLRSIEHVTIKSTKEINKDLYTGTVADFKSKYVNNKKKKDDKDEKFNQRGVYISESKVIDKKSNFLSNYFKNKADIKYFTGPEVFGVILNRLFNNQNFKLWTQVRQYNLVQKDNFQKVALISIYNKGRKVKIGNIPCIIEIDFKKNQNLTITLGDIQIDYNEITPKFLQNNENKNIVPYLKNIIQNDLKIVNEFKKFYLYQQRKILIDECKLFEGKSFEYDYIIPNVKEKKFNRESSGSGYSIFFNNEDFNNNVEKTPLQLKEYIKKTYSVSTQEKILNIIEFSYNSYLIAKFIPDILKIEINKKSLNLSVRTIENPVKLGNIRISNDKNNVIIDFTWLIDFKTADINLGKNEPEIGFFSTKFIYNTLNDKILITKTNMIYVNPLINQIINNINENIIEMIDYYSNKELTNDYLINILYQECDLTSIFNIKSRHNLQEFNKNFYLFFNKNYYKNINKENNKEENDITKFCKYIFYILLKKLNINFTIHFIKDTEVQIKLNNYIIGSFILTINEKNNKGSFSIKKSSIDKTPLNRNNIINIISDKTKLGPYQNYIYPASKNQIQILQPNIIVVSFNEANTIYDFQDTLIIINKIIIQKPLIVIVNTQESLIRNVSSGVRGKMDFHGPMGKMMKLIHYQKLDEINAAPLKSRIAIGINKNVRTSVYYLTEKVSIHNETNKYLIFNKKYMISKNSKLGLIQPNKFTNGISNRTLFKGSICYDFELQYPNSSRTSKFTFVNSHLFFKPKSNTGLPKRIKNIELLVQEFGLIKKYNNKTNVFFTGDLNFRMSFFVLNKKFIFNLQKTEQEINEFILNTVKIYLEKLKSYYDKNQNKSTIQNKLLFERNELKQFLNKKKSITLYEKFQNSIITTGSNLTFKKITGKSPYQIEWFKRYVKGNGDIGTLTIDDVKKIFKISKNKVPRPPSMPDRILAATWDEDIQPFNKNSLKTYLFPNKSDHQMISLDINLQNNNLTTGHTNNLKTGLITGPTPAP